MAKQSEIERGNLNQEEEGLESLRKKTKVTDGESSNIARTIRRKVNRVPT
jgi:hypothetical protein